MIDIRGNKKCKLFKGGGGGMLADLPAIKHFMTSVSFLPLKGFYLAGLRVLWSWLIHALQSAGRCLIFVNDFTSSSP